MIPVLHILTLFYLNFSFSNSFMKVFFTISSKNGNPHRIYTSGRQKTDGNQKETKQKSKRNQIEIKQKPKGNKQE